MFSVFRHNINTAEMAIQRKIITGFFNINNDLYKYLSILIIVLIEFSSTFERENFVFWPNGTIPFYVNPTHFDKEQSLTILSTLSLFAFKTCLQFSPVMVEPQANQHVMVLENPRGVRQCYLDMEGHAREEPHRITVGYSCLRTPHLETIIMKALGFPFEHNRAIRDLYIDVQFENIEPGFIPFFTKEKILPQELRSLPYDVDSVMHFGEREYSKNGHRSFIFKNQQTQQARIGLSKIDLRKIQIIYGPECQNRDRQAKIDICKKYPSVRRKREIKIDIDKVQNLRINREITPPPDLIPPTEENLTDDITDKLKELNVVKEVQDLIEQVHKITAAAVENERVKLCNNTNANTRKSDNNKNNNISDTQPTSNDNNSISNDITKIIDIVINHAKAVINKAKTNLTVFCDNTNTVELIQRANCEWGTNNRCPINYKSTKTGAIRHSTKHRPFIRQSTKHEREKKVQYVNWLRAGNDTQEAINATRKKRNVEILNITENLSYHKIKTNDSYNINNTREDIHSSRLKKESKLDSNNDAIKIIDSFVPIGNDAEKYITVMGKKRKREVEITKPNDEIDVVMKTVNNNKKSIDDTKIRRKREADTIILSDNVNNETEKKNQSLVTNKDDAVKGSLVKMEEVNIDVNATGVKDSLRMATRVFTDKKVDFAPVRRSSRDDGGFRSKENDGQEKSDESSSDERDERIRKSKKKERDESEERERPRKREKQRDREEKRPQNRKPKGKRGRQRAHLPETVPLTKGNKEFYADRIWPDGVVRYVITQDSTYNLESVRARLAEVNDILKKMTCVRIEEISEREGQKYEDYLIIDTSPDYVTGRVGGRQSFGSIELFEGGQHRQHAAMMVMAMLGFYFEPARHDRDRHVRVHNRHVRPDKLHHFEKIRPEATLDLPYDYASATHPAWQFWRRVGRTGISTVATYKDQDPDGAIMKSLGQNEQLLSNLDIIKINSIYGVHCFQRPRKIS